mgnify:CR=1 FL=1
MTVFTSIVVLSFTAAGIISMVFSFKYEAQAEKDGLIQR